MQDTRPCFVVRADVAKIVDVIAIEDIIGTIDIEDEMLRTYQPWNAASRTKGAGNNF